MPMALWARARPQFNTPDMACDVDAHQEHRPLRDLASKNG
jgi:hypothetical protein